VYPKLALSLAVSTLILVIGGFFAVLSRIQGLEEAVQERPVPAASARETTPRKTTAQAALESPEFRKKLDWMVGKIEELGDDAYQYQIDNGKEFYEIQTAVRQIKSTLRRVIQGLGKGSGGGIQIGWGLTPRGTPIDEATATAYKKDAADFGIQVKEGEVRVRGFLNLSPRVEMPIEYFVTRYPNASHETLVHLLGNKDIPGPEENPLIVFKGLATALYKGLVAAGFEQGEPSHADPNSDPKDPQWILASGDIVYLGVRYERDGKEHVALATDWVLDPQSGKVLPPDAFRFTGSGRMEDPNTGDEVLAAEMLGLLVSVWPNATSLVEVALESALRNNYTYNFSRIPKQKGEGQGPLYLDLIFSKTPIVTVGDGALPIDRPPPLAESSPR